jgi:hypothetical protein
VSVQGARNSDRLAAQSLSDGRPGVRQRQEENRLCRLDKIICIHFFQHFQHHADVRAREKEELLRVGNLTEVAEGDIPEKMLEGDLNKNGDIIEHTRRRRD